MWPCLTHQKQNEHDTAIQNVQKTTIAGQQGVGGLGDASWHRHGSTRAGTASQGDHQPQPDTRYRCQRLRESGADPHPIHQRQAVDEPPVPGERAHRVQLHNKLREKYNTDFLERVLFIILK